MANNLLWISISRDGKLYATAAFNGQDKPNSFVFGSISGSNPTVFFSPDSKTGMEVGSGIIGWTAM
jgi:hypothetical protein